MDRARSCPTDAGPRRRYPIAVLAAMIVSGTLLPRDIRAQLVSDSVPIGRTVPEEDEVKEDMERSRLRLGPIRLIPSIAITNAGYDNNVFATVHNQIGDWSGTVVGGLRFLIPFGSKLYFRANALPEYTWYNKLTERRFFGGLYDATIFGFFNRLSFELTGADEEIYRTFSTELDAQVINKTRGGTGRAEVEIAGPFALFAEGTFERNRFVEKGPIPADVPDVRRNDRDQSSFSGGIRYKSSAPWDVSVEYQRTRADFVRTSEIRDNQSSAYLIAFEYRRPLFFLNLSGGYRQGRPRNGSSFPEYSTGVGSFFASVFPMYWLELRAYGHRRVAYSLSVTNPYFFEDRIGAGLNIEVLSRVLLRGFGETGPNKYPLPELVGGDLVKRRDQTRRYSGGISYKLFRNAVLSGTVSRAVYESSIPALSKHYTRYTADLNFLGEYVR